MLELEPTLIYYDPVLTNYICREKTYFQIRTYSEVPMGITF